MPNRFYWELFRRDGYFLWLVLLSLMPIIFFLFLLYEKLSGNTSAESPISVLLIGAVFFVPTYYVIHRRVSKQLYLMQYGVRVTAHECKKIDLRWMYHYFISDEFTQKVGYAFEVNGVRYFGVANASLHKKLFGIKVKRPALTSDSFAVLYDPKNPRRNCWAAPLDAVIEEYRSNAR